jgi:hypothetical protein
VGNERRGRGRGSGRGREGWSSPVFVGVFITSLLRDTLR